MKCNCCGKTLVKDPIPPSYDKHLTTSVGAVRDVKGVICGYCALSLDEDGAFPEEQNREN